jgi:hypothetical protein
MLFSGAKKSVDFPLSKIVTISPVDNGVLIDRSGKVNVEYFVGLEILSVNMTIKPDDTQLKEWEGGTFGFTFNGFEIKKIVQECVFQPNTSLFSKITEGLGQKKEGQKDDEVNLSHLVPWAGIEPALSKELDFESSASTNSATKANIFKTWQK